MRTLLRNVGGRLHPTHGVALGLLAGSVAWRLLRPVRLEVEGSSMVPAFLPGDRLLALRAGRLRAGDVVALPDPRRPERLLVKRVAGTGPAGVDVRGDNAAASTDSRHFGPVPSRSVLGRVRYRYAPAERAGSVGRRRSAG